MKIAVAGAGYVGLSNAVLLAQRHQVVALDIDAARVEALRATLDARDAYEGAQFVIVANATRKDFIANTLFGHD